MTQRNKKVGGEEARESMSRKPKRKGQKRDKKKTSVFLSTFFAVERRKKY